MKVVISRLENELENVKTEMISKTTTIARIEADRDAAKIAQGQAESQILFLKVLFEKLDYQHNQTYIAKTEELRKQIELKTRENEGLLEEQQILRAESNGKNEKIKRCEERNQILSQSDQW